MNIVVIRSSFGCTIPVRTLNGVTCLTLKHWTTRMECACVCDSAKVSCVWGRDVEGLYDHLIVTHSVVALECKRAVTRHNEETHASPGDTRCRAIHICENYMSGKRKRNNIDRRSMCVPHSL